MALGQGQPSLCLTGTVLSPTGCRAEPHGGPGSPLPASRMRPCPTFRPSSLPVPTPISPHPSSAPHLHPQHHPHLNPSSSSHPIPILIPPRKLILFSSPRASSTQRLATPLEAEAEGQKVGARSILCAFEKSSKTREDNESFVFLHRRSTRESLLLLPRVLRHEPLGSHSLSLGSTPNAKACVQVAYSGM